MKRKMTPEEELANKISKVLVELEALARHPNTTVEQLKLLNKRLDEIRRQAFVLRNRT
jgi:hypothetical protein